MKNSIKSLCNKKTMAIFFAIASVVSLTVGYIQARKSAPNLKIIDATEVQTKMASGAHLINVLSRKTYEDLHIKGSMNIPLKQLKSRANQFSKNQTLVVYCASAHCDASHKAARILNRAGFHNVFVYEGGMKDWRNKKLPVTGPGKMRYLQSNTDKARISKTTKKKTASYEKTNTEKRIRRNNSKTQPIMKTTKKGKKTKAKTRKKIKTSKVKTKAQKKNKKKKTSRKQKREREKDLNFQQLNNNK